MHNRISHRIYEIVKNIPHCNYFVEIGCDHGYITYLVHLNKIADHIIAADISLPSLRKCQNLFDNDVKNISFVQSDGLKNIPEDKCEVCLMAGLGGAEIIKILQEGYFPKTLVLQPMKDAKKLREYLAQNGYSFIIDKVIKDIKFYDLIVAKKGDEIISLTEMQKSFGVFYYLAQKELIEKLKFKKNNYEAKFNTMPNINKADKLLNEYNLICKFLSENK